MDVIQVLTPKESTFRQRMMLHLAVTSEEKKTLTAAEEFTWTSFAKVQSEIESTMLQNASYSRF